MKKILSIVLVVVLALTCLALVACGGSHEGVYKFKSLTMTAGDQSQTYNVGDTSPWGDVLSADSNVMELKADGTVVATSIVDDETMTQNGTYTIDGETISITIEGSTTEATIKNGTITVTNSYSGTTMAYVYEKA